MFAFQFYNPVTQQKRLILFLNADKRMKERKIYRIQRLFTNS